MIAAVRKTGRYRGPDRRTRLGETQHAPTGELLTQAGMLVAGMLLPTALLLGAGTGLVTVANVLQSMASLAELVAGIALLICWKVRGQAVLGWLGVAFANSGALSLGYYRVSAVAPGHSVLNDPYGCLIPCLFAGVAVLGALRSPTVDAGLDPLRTVVASVAMGLILIGALDLAARGDQASNVAVVSTRSVCGAVWLALAVMTIVSRHRRSVDIGPWVVGYLFLAGAGQSFLAAFGRQTWASAVAGLCFLAASSLALTAAGWDLRSALRSQDNHSLRLRTAADSLRHQLEAERAELDEQLHDLRNAVAGIRSADATLRRYAGRLDEDTRTSLADALTSELSRLQALIDPHHSLQQMQLRLDEALGGVLSTAQTAGLQIETDLGGISALGDGDALAQVVQNVLANARQYAPGSLVTVRGELLVDRVRVRIWDEGPGVAAEERDSIFQRGVRGSTAKGRHGSGLGLFVARRLMNEMGGNIRLDDRPDGGACFVLEMPAALEAAGEGSDAGPHDVHGDVLDGLQLSLVRP